VGSLHLVHLDAVVWNLVLDRVRSECDVPCAPGEPQETHAHESESRHGQLHSLLDHWDPPFVQFVDVSVCGMQYAFYVIPMDLPYPIRRRESSPHPGRAVPALTSGACTVQTS